MSARGQDDAGHSAGLAGGADDQSRSDFDVAKADAAVTERRGRMTSSAGKVLVIDVGGTHVKLLITGRRGRREFPSSLELTPAQMVKRVKEATPDWRYDVISMGFPGPVSGGKILLEPANLGSGWMRFDFERAFGCPIKIVNDAMMQAIGSYRGGHMLFLGFGTGLGTAMIVDGVAVPMELAHLPYKKGTYEDYVGLRGLERYGKKRWRRYVLKVVSQLKTALLADDVVLGGGNAKHLKGLPPGARLCTNASAFRGGFGLWRRGSASMGPLTRASRRRAGRPGRPLPREPH